MPCIKVEVPCQCWSGEELASIDGLGQTLECLNAIVTIGMENSMAPQ